MCGACGSVTVPDPALGPVRTMRQHVIVAHAINAVCRRLPGAPRVTALSGGWLMSGSTGSTRLCHTVEELWTAIIDDSFNETAQLNRLHEEQEAYSADPLNTGLAEQVIDLGRARAEVQSHRNQISDPTAAQRTPDHRAKIALRDSSGLLNPPKSAGS